MPHRSTSTSTSTSPGPSTPHSSLGRVARRWAPLRAVLAALLVIAALHIAWALGIWWPASSSDTLADTVVGRQPFPPSAVTAGVAALLIAAVGCVVVSMRNDMPPLVGKFSCWASNIVVVVLALRGIFGEISSITNLEDATTRFRILDLVLFSPLCLWAALGIHYRWLTGSTSPPIRPTTTSTSTSRTGSST